MIRTKLFAPLLAGLLFSAVLATFAGSVVALGGCGILGEDQGVGGSDSACDNQGNCNSCTQCAAQDLCRSALDNCQQSSACTGLDQCLGLCSGAVQCEQDCYAGNQSGVALHDTLRICLLCRACESDCAGQTSCE